MHDLLRATDRLLSTLARRGMLGPQLLRLRHTLVRYVVARTKHPIARP